MSLSLFALLPLLASTSAEAGGHKADVCHYNSSPGYNLLNVSTGSAHFDPAIHPNDVIPQTVYLDLDGDGLGDPGTGTVDCPSSSTVDNGDDCDDSDDTVGQCATYRLFGLVDDQIVGIDTDTGAATLYLTPAFAGGATQLSWDPDDEVFYSLDSGADLPQLVAIDPCDGTILTDEPVESSTLGPAFFCEGFDFDQDTSRLIASCSFNGSIANYDYISETVVELDVTTGVATTLISSPYTGADNEFDLFVFIGGGEARTFDGQGTLASNRWFQTDTSTWSSSYLGSSAPYGPVAWDWAGDELYTVNWSTAASPFYLETQDVDSRTTTSSIGDTGLSINNQGLTFADFTCP